ncbi:DUF5710 domain-containing protein [Comamonas sp.]|jgi:hypothetical protein|uniref:DUF5710 domain-containing protein n=1 Tax=Comamonas sp. TaxID=34028 RepID=UPI00289F7D18|nr:DUF5710 domain-containing protein [Comamonas sp.]
MRMISIFSMYAANNRLPGFWIWRITWGNRIAKVKRVEDENLSTLARKALVWATVYDLHTGEVTEDDFQIDTGGTVSDWCWAQPPSWSGEPPHDLRAGKVLLNVPFEENRKAKSLGARWSDVLDAWCVEDTNAKALAKAKSLGYLEPEPERVFFVVPYEQRQLGIDVRAKWEKHARLWSVPASDKDAISYLRAAGFEPKGIDPAMLAPRHPFRLVEPEKIVARSSGFKI